MSSPAVPEVIYRHSRVVRIWHWINFLALSVLLLTGLYIFNMHPRLYWGEEGYEGLPALASVSVQHPESNHPIGVLRLGRHQFNTTGVLGFAVQDPEYPGEIKQWAFAPAVVFPSPGHLGDARALHFTMAWLLVIALTGYLIYSLICGHLWRDLMPNRHQITPRALLRDLWWHLRLKRFKGEEARSYNVLQRLTYLIVIGVLLPLQILSGMMISNSFGAILPQAYTLIGGRESARTIHFCIAVLLLAFFVVHLAQVFHAGVRNEIRSMITGRFTVPPEERPK